MNDGKNFFSLVQNASGPVVINFSGNAKFNAHVGDKKSSFCASEDSKGSAETSSVPSPHKSSPAKKSSHQEPAEPSTGSSYQGEPKQMPGSHTPDNATYIGCNFNIEDKSVNDNRKSTAAGTYVEGGTVSQTSTNSSSSTNMSPPK